MESKSVYLASVRLFVLSSLASALVACGGGSSGSSTSSSSSSQSTNTVSSNSKQNPDAFTKSNIPLQMTDSAASLRALNELSIRRQSCGFGAVVSDTKLTQVASYHAAYIAYVLNKAKITTFDPHVEAFIKGNNVTGQNNPYYSGYQILDRIKAAGYQPHRSISTENIALKYISNSTGIQTSNADAAVSMIHGLMSAPYHLRTLFDPRMDKVSASMMSFTPYGKNYETHRRYVLELVSAASQAKAKPSGLLTYPCQGISGTQTALYHESPDPYFGSTRKLGKDPVGQPIYVFYPSATNIELSNVRFEDTQRNTSLKFDIIDDSRDPYANNTYAMRSNEAFIIPLTDNIGRSSCDANKLALFNNQFTANNCGLYANTTYRVSFDVNVDGRIESHQFTFTTGETNYSIS